MPFVQIITDVQSVPEAALFERLRRAEISPPDARAHLEVQLRDPDLPVRRLLRLGERLRVLTASLGARLIINDRVDLAMFLGADGVHLGRRSMAPADARALLGPGAFVSCSAHSIDDVVAAARAGADAALLSPIFASPGKGPPLGPGALTAARTALREAGLSVRLYALGGVNLDNAETCILAGAGGLAAIRANLLALLGPTSSTPSLS